MHNKNFPELMIEKHGNLQNAVAWFRKHINRSPLEYRINCALLLNIMGHEEESFALSDELMTFAPNDPRVLFNRGWHLIKRQQFLEGHRLLEYGRGLGSYGDQKPASGAPVFDLDSKKYSKYTLMVLEGGLGDQIIQARFAKSFTEKTGWPVHLAAHSSLISVLSRINGVASLISREMAGALYHEQWLPGMSAAHLLHNSFDEIPGNPYVTSHPHFDEKWQSLIANLNPEKKKKIGIRWAGAPHFEHQQLRKFPPKILTDLNKIEKIKLFSFQRDNDLIELAPDVVNLGPFITSWEDTLSAINQMDIIISSCTSVAHMSAALGKTTWVLVPVLPYFVWAIPGESSPWYQSARLFRQKKFGEWSDVQKKLELALENCFSS